MCFLSHDFPVHRSNSHFIGTIMSDEDERPFSTSSNSLHVVNQHRRISEIKLELQGLMRQKKKYDAEKLTQDAEFLQREITEISSLIHGINIEINDHTDTKNNLHVEMTNLRSRSRLHHSNPASALRAKRQLEIELRKENKSEKYRELVRGKIQSIEATLPILREEDAYRTRHKSANDAQQAATTRRKRLEESLNKNICKQREIKQLFGEIADKLPRIETNIDNLRSERQRLISSSGSALSNGRRTRRFLSSRQGKAMAVLSEGASSVRSLGFLDDHPSEQEKQLANVNTLVNYFRDQMKEHGLNVQTLHSPVSSELGSPVRHPLTSQEEQSILSSYMNEQDSDGVSPLAPNRSLSSSAIAMQLPRSFASSDLNSTSTNEIIQSPYRDRVEIEYKKEISSDILVKYGGQVKQSKSSSFLTGKKCKKNRKNFAISHPSQMITLYNSVRTSSGSSDALPSMPMFEYDLLPTIKALELVKRSLESYLNEVSTHFAHTPLTSLDDRHKGFAAENEDSTSDAFSEVSSLAAPMYFSRDLTPIVSPLMNAQESRSCESSDERKSVQDSPRAHQYGSKIAESELNLLVKSLTIQSPRIDRQMSDEGYRSVHNDQPQPTTGTSSSHHPSPLLMRSKSYDSAGKVNSWLSTTTPTPLVSSLLIPVSDHDTNIRRN